MIIDTHTHLGFKNGLKGTAKELVSSMDAAGIDKAMVFAGDIFDCPTTRLLEEVKVHPDRLYPIASVTMNSAKDQARHRLRLEALNTWFKTNQIFGLKFYTGYEHFYPSEEDLVPYFKLLIKYNKPAIFHSGDTFNCCKGAKLKYAKPIHIDDPATDYPELKIIIAHMGSPWVIDAGEVVYKNSNVYADCSGFVYGSFDEIQKSRFQKAVDQFLEIANDPNRLFFGSDWPICDQKSYVETFKNCNSEDLNRVVMKVFGI